MPIMSATEDVPSMSQENEGLDSKKEAAEHAIEIGDSLQMKFKLIYDANSLMMRSLDDEAAKNSKSHIQKVPTLLRQNKYMQQYFQPHAISIGPLHRDDKSEQLVQGEKLKLSLAKDIIGANDIAKLFGDFFSNIKSFKDCYAAHQEIVDGFEDEDLAWMLFVDGCAMLQYMRSYVRRKFHKMNIESHIVELISQDLLLLENQLPYSVLELLMNKMSTEDENLSHYVDQFINIIVDGQQQHRRMRMQKQDHDAKHLLHLLWKRLAEQVTSRGWLFRRLYNLFSANEGKEISWYPSRCVKELEAAGIELKPSRHGDLLGISFDAGFIFGNLEIPKITLDELHKTIFMNLIAFEMCPDFKGDCVVTSYISFMNSLMAHGHDVAKLRTAQILVNCLAINDEEVVMLFRRMAFKLIASSDTYNRVKHDIDHYFRRRRMKIATWISEAMQVYFRSPWTTIAVLYATIILILTLVQTIFTILP